MKARTYRKKIMMGVAVVVCFCLISISTVSLSMGTPSDSGSPVFTTYSTAYKKLLDFFYYHTKYGFSFAVSHFAKLTGQLKSFSSYDELGDYLKDNAQNGRYGLICYEDSMLSSTNSISKANICLPQSTGEGAGSSVSYSKTNTQVAGVDEPDIVKSDGAYLYYLVDSTLYIIQAYPAENAQIVSKILLNQSHYQSNIFVNDDLLIVLSSSYRYAAEPYEDRWYGGVSTAAIHIYDIQDRSNPILVKDVTLDGSYFDARMIGDYVYMVTTQYSTDICYVEEEKVKITPPELCINGESQQIPASQMYYVDVPEKMDTMTHVLSIDLSSFAVEEKSFLLGCSQTLYVSQNTIYLTYTSYEYATNALGGWVGSTDEKTLIHKIAIDIGDITYVAQGEVAGHLLNQFSMDEHQGFFRIATTIGNVWDHDRPCTNNIYILDDKLNMVSSIEKIAPGERIYSARFMGDRAYLVTFKKIDPFFTFDLSDPYHPQLMGKLKIPGYSDYLHPYDENHIIGIGKDTEEATDDQKTSRNLDFAWYQGIKIALFDVTDFENPVQKDKVIIGDRGSTSPILYDHKALLFDKAKQLFVLPVTVYQIDQEIKQQNNGYTGSLRGEFSFQGVYIYRITENGFVYRGKISHKSTQLEDDGGSWYRGSSTEIKRALYIEHSLFTLSDSMVEIHDLKNLEEITYINL